MSFGCPSTLDQYRLAIQGDRGDAENGFLDIKPKGLRVMFSSGYGWEHVSFSRRSRMPDYDDMCWIKQKFWGANETVMQLFVPADEHVNMHPYCLHLWRPLEAEIPKPPPFMVGVR